MSRPNGNINLSPEDVYAIHQEFEDREALRADIKRISLELSVLQKKLAKHYTLKAIGVRHARSETTAFNLNRDWMLRKKPSKEKKK